MLVLVPGVYAWGKQRPVRGEGGLKSDSWPAQREGGNATGLWF